ncbi:hypothetical protein D3C76_1768810 [compost metagenome]
MSWLMANTNVLASILFRAASRSPPVLREISARCHFHTSHSRAFGSIGSKYAFMKLFMKSVSEDMPKMVRKRSS